MKNETEVFAVRDADDGTAWPRSYLQRPEDMVRYLRADLVEARLRQLEEAARLLRECSEKMEGSAGMTAERKARIDAFLARPEPQQPEEKSCEKSTVAHVPGPWRCRR